MIEGAQEQDQDPDDGAAARKVPSPVPGLSRPAHSKLRRHNNNVTYTHTQDTGTQPTTLKERALEISFSDLPQAVKASFINILPAPFLPFLTAPSSPVPLVRESVSCDQKVITMQQNAQREEEERGEARTRREQRTPQTERD